jgi:hypothetical protein
MEQLVQGLASGFASSFAAMINELSLFLLGLVLAAPAIGTMFQIPLERRLPIVTRSIIAAIAGGVTLTILGTIAVILAVNGMRGLLPSDYRIGRDLVHVAVALTAIAAGIQVSAWKTFTWLRAISLLSTSLAWPVFAKADEIFRHLTQ